MKQIKTKLKHLWESEAFWKYASIVVFVLANIMFVSMAFGKVYPYDEAYSLGMSYNSFGDIIKITSQDVHSPFYYYGLKLFCMLPGLSLITGAKLFTWIFMVAYMVFGWVVLRKHYDSKVVFFWTLLSGFMPAMIIQSTTARMYTMGLFFVTVAGYYGFMVYKEETRKRWILFTVFSIFAVYVHTFSMLQMVAAYGVFVLVTFFKKDFKKLGKVFLSGIVVSIAYLPWLIALFGQFSRWVGWENDGWGSNFAPVTLDSSIAYLSEWFSSLENPQPLAVIFGVALFLYMGYYTRKYVEETKDYLPLMGLILAGLVLTVAILVSIYMAPCFMGRYLFPLFGGVWLFAAVGIAKSGHWLKQTVVIVLVVYFGLQAYQEEVRLDDTTGADIYIERMDAQLDIDEHVIMADRYFTLMMSIYYPEANYMVYGYGPTCLPFQNVEVFKEWPQLDGVDTVWLISFADAPGASLGEKYETVECFQFDYSYYKMKVEKLIRK